MSSQDKKNNAPQGSATVISVPVVSSSGEVIRSVSFTGPEILSDSLSRGFILHEIVRWQRACRRAGTHSTLTKGMMKGGNRKPWKQKGTGRARCGSNTSPIWVGGGIAHGPKPRSYVHSLNKRSKRYGLAAVLHEKAQAGKLVVLDTNSVGTKNASTKSGSQLLGKIGVSGSAGALFVTSDFGPSLDKSLRNICGVKTLTFEALNVYDCLNCDFLVLSEASLKRVEQRIAA
jgi:large subunit ribosomal protein L4